MEMLQLAHLMVASSYLNMVSKGYGYFQNFNADDKEVEKRTGLVPADDKPKAYTCLTFNKDGDALVGSSNCGIFLFKQVNYLFTFDSFTMVWCVEHLLHPFAQ